MTPKRQSQRQVESMHAEEAIETAGKRLAHHGIDKVQPDQKVQALALALLAERQMLHPDELNRLEALHEYAFDTQRLLIDIAETFKQIDSHIMTVKSEVTAIQNRKLSTKRATGVVRRNYHVDPIDAMSQLLREEIDHIGAIAKVTQVFSKEAIEEENARSGRTVPITDPSVRKTADRVEGYLKALNDFRGRMASLPDRCREVVRHVNAYRQSLVRDYSKEKEDDTHTKLPWFVFGAMNDEPAERVPIYNGNLHLTGFLHEVYNQIPVIVQRKKNDTPRYDESEGRAYEDYLKGFTDTKLLNYLEKGGFFQKASALLGKVCAIYKTIEHVVQEKKIDEADAKHPDNSVGRFRDDVWRLRREASMQDEKGIIHFEPAQALGVLENMNLTTLPTDIPPLPDGEGSKRERQMLEIFAAIHKRLTAEACGLRDDDDDWKTFVAKMITKKHLVRGEKSHRRKSRLREDSRHENWAYEVKQSSFNDIELKQVPTTSTTLEDVIGSSWQKVRDDVTDILRYGRMEHVLNAMHPRGNAKKNMLILSGWGMGKNHFSRALMNDPRVVGVHLSTADLVTAYMNESEANVGRLFQEMRETRDKHDKPIVYVWDEFDSVAPNEDEGENVQKSSRAGMMKELQSQLDGNHDNSGIFGVFLANYPEPIPIEIYRRMRHVEVIRPFDEIERLQLLHHYLMRMPLEPDFFKRTDLRWIAEQTPSASGEVLGAIIDSTFEKLLALADRKNPGALYEINDVLGDALADGDHITLQDKLGLFDDHAPGVAVSPEMFLSAAQSVLAAGATKTLMSRQADYDRTIDGRLAIAMDGWESKPDFLPPPTPEEREK